ncbi:MAG: hypothetical protein AAF570_04395, partial [Bacteroidota bacterium]
GFPGIPVCFETMDPFWFTDNCGNEVGILFRWRYYRNVGEWENGYPNDYPFSIIQTLTGYQ